jgi:hypothetical protein
MALCLPQAALAACGVEEIEGGLGGMVQPPGHHRAQDPRDRPRRVGEKAAMQVDGGSSV